MKKIFLAVFISFIFLASFSSAHVNHYKKIKYLRYELFLNNNLIGSHIFNFKKKGDLFQVIGEGKFKVSTFGVELMNYQTKSEEIYQCTDGYGTVVITYNENTTRLLKPYPVERL